MTDSDTTLHSAYAIEETPPSAGSKFVRLLAILGALGVLWWMSRLAPDLWIILDPGSFLVTGAILILGLALMAPSEVSAYGAAGAGAVAFLTTTLAYTLLSGYRDAALDENAAVVTVGVLSAGALLAWLLLRRWPLLRWHLVIAASFHAALTGVGARLQHNVEPSLIDQRPELLLACYALWVLSALFGRR